MRCHLGDTQPEHSIGYICILETTTQLHSQYVRPGWHATMSYDLTCAVSAVSARCRSCSACSLTAACCTCLPCRALDSSAHSPCRAVTCSRAANNALLVSCKLLCASLAHCAVCSASFRVASSWCASCAACSSAEDASCCSAVQCCCASCSCSLSSLTDA